MKLLAGALAGIVVVSVVAGAGYNYATLQRPVTQALAKDSRNDGIEISLHYQYYVAPNRIVFDLESVRDDATMADVFRVLLQAAAALQGRTVEYVHLAHRGQTKFLLKGDYFRSLGVEYSTQNPVYTMRTLPENLYRPDGTQAFQSWTGGLLGVLGKQLEDFNQFHRQWYIDDLAGGD